MDRTAKVFLACALGAFVGALVALEVNHYLWWLGLITGGLVGYLSYEWRRVLAAIPAAYRAARGWQAPPRYWECVGWMTIGFFFVGMWFFTGTAIPFAIAHWVGREEIYVLLSLCFGFGGLSGLASLAVAMENRVETINIFKRMSYWLFPPLLLFWHLPRALIWLIPRIPAASVYLARGTVSLARFTKCFTWHLFRLIHSDERLLCGLDAAIGVGVGYLAGNAALGALAGGLLGVVNYELISKRLLHLVPAKNG